MQMKQNGKYRMASWWVLWRDLDWPSPDNQDRIRRRADAMAESGVNAAVIFGAHFRWDFMPYWTMLHDYLATVGSELRARGVALFDHHSGTLVHRYDTREEWHNVKLNSIPHLPFSPDRTSAAAWKYKGSYLNDWRMIDLQTGKPVWHEQYTAEEFCFNNPDFREAYLDYLRRLLKESAIDGLMADDFIYFNGYRSCGCRCCRKIFRDRFGFELPDFSDRAFWCNWDNPDWCAYLDMRYESNGDMLSAIHSVLPSADYPLMSCCSGSSTGFCNNTAQDIRQFLRGCNLVHLEMCGDIPPWKEALKTPMPRSSSIPMRIAAAGHHHTAGQKADAECVGLGYAFFEQPSGVIWALNKFLGAGTWLSTLKGRLGLPEHILDAMPEEPGLVRKFYRFEAEHPELFCGRPLASIRVYFSYETRNHTFYGNLEYGYPKEFCDTVSTLMENGISPEVVFSPPEYTEEIPVLILPGAVRMTEEEVAGFRKFLADGGTIFATGPCGFPGVEMQWPMPNRSSVFPDPLFLLKEKPLPCRGERVWKQISNRFYWNVGTAKETADSLRERLAEYLSLPAPVRVGPCPGYCTSVHAADDGSFTVHFLAADYRTDVDRKLEAMRTHHSRVHCITTAVPENTARKILLETHLEAEAFAPLSSGAPKLVRHGAMLELQLPEACTYAVVRLSGKADAPSSAMPQIIEEKSKNASNGK